MHDLVNLPSAKFHGKHLIVELWGVAEGMLTNDEYISTSLQIAAEEAGATILHTHFHHFGEGYGVTGVIILAESHITIHTWPENGYAAIDMFMCGKCDPKDALPIVQARFKPEHMDVNELIRGLVFQKHI